MTAAPPIIIGSGNDRLLEVSPHTDHPSSIQQLPVAAADAVRRRNHMSQVDHTEELERVCGGREVRMSACARRGGAAPDIPAAGETAFHLSCRARGAQIIYSWDSGGIW